MSLFGSLGQNQPASTSGSLFGSLGATSSAQTGSTLFGSSSTSQPQQQSSIFGSALKPPASQASTSGGLFSIPSATSQAQSASGSLFGSLGTTTSQPQQSSTLFGSLGTSNPQPSTSGSLFGNLGASTSQPAGQTGSSSLFPKAQGPDVSGQKQTQAQNVQSTFAPAVRSQTAYFDQMLERGKKRNNQENRNLGDLPSLQLGLGDIARKVRNLGTGGPSADQAKPNDTRAYVYSNSRHVVRALTGLRHYLLAASGAPVASALHDLNQVSAQAGAAVLPPAAGVSDTDIEGFVSNVRTQATLEMIQDGIEHAKREFDDFLEENVQMNWDLQRRKIYEHFGLARPSEDAQAGTDGALAGSQRGAFGRSSRRARAFGASVSSSGNMSFGPAGMTKSVLGNSSMRNALRAGALGDTADKTAAGALQGLPEDRFQRDKQEKYVEKVKELNQARNQEQCYPLLHKFAEVEQQAGIDNTVALANSYECLIRITGEKPSVLPRADKNAVPERKFKDQYLNERDSLDEALAMRRQIIHGSRICLEQIFMGKLEATVAKDPKVANLGGVPEPINKVRAYIRVLTYRRELAPEPEKLQTLNDGSNEDFLWALIYHLLRAGLVKEAGRYVASNQKAIRSIDRNFPRCMAAYAESPDRGLPPELRQVIQTEYQTRLQPGGKEGDPYQVACYKIVGRCDLSRRTLEGIRTDEQDWMWLQLALARETPRQQETAGESFGLEDLQHTIRDIGQRHFSQTSDNPSGVGTYFLLQILSGMFEQAVAWLYPHNHIAAVHFAIALDYYGLLRVADLSSTELCKCFSLWEACNNLHSLVSYNTREQPRLNFGLMVGYYTADFRAAKPEAATDYLILICLNADLDGEAGRQQAELCYEALRELVLETREFAALVGDIRSDGQRVPGAIEQRLKLIRHKDIKTEEDNKAFLKTLTMQAASAADDSGRVTDAVLLYHLAEEYDTVITIVNRALSEALSVELGQSPLRLEPLKPRAPLPDQNQQQKSQQQPSQSSGASTSTLSLTAVSDPVTLSKNMYTLYANGSILFTQIKPANREACLTLQNMATARTLLEAGNSLRALQAIEALNLLPLNARGSIAVIRGYANTFSDLPLVVAARVGDLLIWAVLALAKERERLRSGEWENVVRKVKEGEVAVAARDLLVFAGLIRYKLPPRVFEVLSRVGQDVGA